MSLFLHENGSRIICKCPGDIQLKNSHETSLDIFLVDKLQFAFVSTEESASILPCPTNRRHSHCDSNKSNGGLFDNNVSFWNFFNQDAT